MQPQAPPGCEKYALTAHEALYLSPYILSQVLSPRLPSAASVVPGLSGRPSERLEFGTLIEGIESCRMRTSCCEQSAFGSSVPRWKVFEESKRSTNKPRLSMSAPTSAGNIGHQFFVNGRLLRTEFLLKIFTCTFRSGIGRCDDGKSWLLAMIGQNSSSGISALSS
jgi:hypothetical protein